LALPMSLSVLKKLLSAQQMLLLLVLHQTNPQPPKRESQKCYQFLQTAKVTM
jgi:hypothetical protein